MTDNVIHFQKTDHFAIYVGNADQNGQINEKQRIGIAFMKPGAKKFRIKLWLMSGVSYFVVPDDNDQKKYVVIVPEQFSLPNGELRTRWHRIGHGEVLGSYIKIRIHLFAPDLYLSLFPETPRAQSSRRGNVEEEVIA